MLKRTIITAVLMCVVSTGYAETFSGHEFSFGTKVSKGSTLDCETTDAIDLQRSSPKMFAWATAEGYVEISPITRTPSYTSKITTKSLGKPTLIIGCWVTNEVISEIVNGKKEFFATGSFKINALFSGSPISEISFCKKIKEGFRVFTQGDYRPIHELDSRKCEKTNWQVQISPLKEMEKETAIFSLKEPLDKKGLIRDVSWGF